MVKFNLRKAIIGGAYTFIAGAIVTATTRNKAEVFIDTIMTSVISAMACGFVDQLDEDIKIIRE